MPSLEVLSRTQRIVVLPNTSVSIVKEGPTGPKGDQGPMGLMGPMGPTGLDGATVAADLYIPIDGSPTSVDTSIDFLTAPSIAGETLEPLRMHIEDDPHVFGDQGVLSLAVRHDDDTATVDDDGDYSSLHTDSSGKLKVSGPLTDDELRATPIAVTGDFASDGLTNTELRAAPVASGLQAWNTAAWNPVYGASTSDGAAPSVTSLFTFSELGLFDGTNWNMARGSIANGMEVDVKRLPAVALDAASLAALENTTVTIDAASLASLETINVANIAGTEYAEDSAHVSGAAGILPLAVRRDADTTLADTTGDYAPLQVDASGKLKVVVTGGGGGGVQFAEDVAAVSGDLGTFILAMRHDADTATVGTDGDYSALHTDASGKLKVTGGTSPATTGANTTVANAIADGLALASNANRKGASIFNDDTYGTGSVANIALGFTASATAFTVKLPPQGLYELPSNYTGEVRRYSSAATGSLRVTELT